MDEEGTVKVNTAAIKSGFNKTFDFFKQKKVITTIIILLFLVLLISSSTMRLQNLPLLKDSTTGEYIPLALDPFYFLRLAETIIEQGGLPEVDVMRYPSAKIGFADEILPQALVLLFKIGKIFDKDVTIQFIDVISPVIFFILGLIAFFFLIYVLTNSKMTALISSAFLAFIPTYLHRTLAGFADHESIGIFVFFLALLSYGLALKFLNLKEESKRNLIKTILWGLLVGFLSALTIATWTGVSKFVFMIIPLSFGLFWLIKVQDTENLDGKLLKNFLIFYMVWFFSSILFGLIFGFNFSSLLSIVFLGINSLLNGAVLLFLLIDFSMIKLRNHKIFNLKEKLKKYRVLFSVLATAFLGAIFLSLYGKNIFSLIPNLIDGLLYPFGTSRVGLTVAENKQPFLNDWIGQTGKIFFWLFFGGLITLGIKIARKIKQNEKAIFFGIVWVIFISGILFSRISPSSAFDGVNFISKLFYIGSIILFFGYLTYVYFKVRINIRPELIILFSWMFFMLISARGAIRLFFVITPFVCFSAGFFIVNLFNSVKKTKDDLLKMLLGIIIILVVIGALFSFNNFVKATSVQAEFTGPSANLQWQKAMSWVRENTPNGSIFVHWWDYGHWVTYLGERPVVTDGGHGVGYWDHLIGRYLLTTPEPETALSFMKSHNVSYLLIDPSDIGKYPAYSSIGSDETGNDRFSQINIMVSNPQQTTETKDGTIRIYQVGSLLDGDIVYELEGNQIFLPAGRAALGGILLETKQEENELTFKQPAGAFIYNQKQTDIPIRYLYFNNEFKDFGNGLNAIVYIIPIVQQSNQGIQIDNLGAGIYLSPKNMNSLFAQLYLLNDPLGQYPTIKLAHSEPDSAIGLLNKQGTNLNEFVYFNGIRGPMKIWKVDYPSNILEKEEFLRTSGDYAEFDDLVFLR